MRDSFLRKRVELKGGDPILAYSLLKTRCFNGRFYRILSGGLLAAVILFLHMRNNICTSLLKSGVLDDASCAGFRDRSRARRNARRSKGPVKAARLSGVISFAGFCSCPPG
ncbi:hypothetical protein PO124_11940 [Bacillus licheniformis]|nr:hypothetical protein [Bacillus licheniformis]